jgi:hypothetical protein
LKVVNLQWDVLIPQVCFFAEPNIAMLSHDLDEQGEAGGNGLYVSFLHCDCYFLLLTCRAVGTPRRDSIKILLLGDSSVGKSSLMFRFVVCTGVRDSDESIEHEYQI